MFRIASVVLASVLGGLTAPAFAQSCPEIDGLELAQLHCAMTDRGLIIAESPERAQSLLALTESGADRFETLFARKAAPYAIVDRTEGGLSGGDRQALTAAGYLAILPWLSPDGFRSQMSASVRRAIEANTSAMTEEQREAALKSALAQLESRLSDSAAADRDATAIPHELGHMWLIRAFWPQMTEFEGGHYGGPGPDWLDELAAVLHEPETMAAQRRDHFAKRLNVIRASQAKGEEVTDSLLDLTAYLTKAHPVGGNPQELMAQTGGAPTTGGATIRVLTGAEAQRVSGDGIRFYLQSRLVADYVLERSGDPAIFGKIAALEKNWLAWLDLKYPAAPS